MSILYDFSDLSDVDFSNQKKSETRTYKVVQIISGAPEPLNTLQVRIVFLRAHGIELTVTEAGSALNSAKKYGYISGSSKGKWSITSKGKEYLMVNK